MRLSPDEKKELRDLRVVFEANGGRGVEDADRIDELERKARLVERVVTVKLEILVDPEVTPGGALAACPNFIGLAVQPHLDEILDLPEDPDDDPEKGFWLVAAKVTG